VGAALSNPRSVGAAESSALASFAVPLAVLAVVAFLFPRLVAWSIAGVAAILAGWLLQRSIRLRRWQGRDEAPPG
jgi:hypothetical protein